MTASSGSPARSAYAPHRCVTPERGTRGEVFECWCGRDWVATSTLTIRGGHIVSMRPDWRYAGMRRPDGTRRRPGRPKPRRFD